MPTSKRRAEFEKSLTVMDKTLVRKLTFEQLEAIDEKYWFSRTPVERLIALEHIRQLAWGYNDQSRPKLQGSADLLKLRRCKVSGRRRLRS